MARRKRWGPFDKRVKVTRLVPAGYGHERLVHAHSHTEKLFRLAWQANHTGPMYGSSSGCDLLFHLLQNSDVSTGGLFFGKAPEAVTERDRKVAATVIQWLGTNVGMGFLHMVLSKNCDTWGMVQLIDQAVRYGGILGEGAVRLRGRRRLKRGVMLREPREEARR